MARSHPQEEELGCAVVFQRLSAVKTLSWPCQGTCVGEKDWPGAMGTVSLLLPGSHLASRDGKKGKKGEEEKEKSPKNPTHCLMHTLGRTPCKRRFAC